MVGFPINLIKFGNEITIYNTNDFKAKTAEGYKRIEEVVKEVKKVQTIQDIIDADSPVIKPIVKKSAKKKGSKNKKVSTK